MRGGQQMDDAEAAMREVTRQQILDAYGLKAWQIGIGPMPRWVRWTAPLRRVWYWYRAAWRFSLGATDEAPCDACQAQCCTQPHP
jgi:hypothetical protein